MTTTPDLPLTTPESSPTAPEDIGAIAETFTKEILPCRLANYELVEVGRNLEAELARRDEIERERKDAADRFKEQIEDQNSKIRELRKCIRTQSVDRPVTVRIVHDYRRGQIVRTREDTGEILTERPMTTDERQQEMPL